MRALRLDPDRHGRAGRGRTPTVLFSADYEPFGTPYNVGGTLVESFKFTGEKHDGATAFVYLRARQYDSDLGRFVSADPVLGSLGMPQTLNRYAYVVNNPLKYTDPRGRSHLSSPSRSSTPRGPGLGVTAPVVPEVAAVLAPVPGIPVPTMSLLLDRS